MYLSYKIFQALRMKTFNSKYNNPIRWITWTDKKENFTFKLQPAGLKSHHMFYNFSQKNRARYFSLGDNSRKISNPAFWKEFHQFVISWSCPEISKCNELNVHVNFEQQGPVVQNLTKLLAEETLQFLSKYMANTLIFFAENILAFALYVMQKLLTYLQQKYQCIWYYLSYNI